MKHLKPKKLKVKQKLQSKNPLRKGKGSKDAIGDRKKPRLSLINKQALWEIGDALTYGESTKGRDQWKLGIETSYLIDAAFRHLLQFMDGEDLDSDSKCSHLGSAMANLSFAIWMLKHRPDLDDRWNKKKPKS